MQGVERKDSKGKATGEMAQIRRRLAELERSEAERKRAEERRQRMNRELRNFVSVVSHDLKSPIMTIQGFASRLRKNLQPEPEGRVARYLEQIMASAQRMELLVTDLLALSKSGRIVSTLREVHSLEIVRGVTLGL